MGNAQGCFFHLAEDHCNFHHMSQFWADIWEPLFWWTAGFARADLSLTLT